MLPGQGHAPWRATRNERGFGRRRWLVTLVKLIGSLDLMLGTLLAQVLLLTAVLCFCRLGSLLVRRAMAALILRCGSSSVLLAIVIREEYPFTVRVADRRATFLS